MSNLISSQFARLFKSKIFYLSLIFFIGTAVFYSVPEFIYFEDSYYVNPTFGFFMQFPRQFHPFSKDNSILDFLDSEFFDWLHNLRLYTDNFMKTNTACYIIIMALLISLLIGRDFGNNTIRNKIIAGYSRIKIYISNLIVVVSAGIIMQIVYMISIFIPFFILYFKYKAISEENNFTVHLFENTFKENLVIQLLVLLIIVVYCSIFLMFTMVSFSNYKSVLISLLVVILTILISKSVEQTLHPDSFVYYMDSYLYPDFSDSYEEDSRGENLSGAERMFNLLADDILTVRQSAYLSLSSGIPARTANYIIYDSAIIIISNALGIIIFNRKELK